LLDEDKLMTLRKSNRQHLILLNYF